MSGDRSGWATWPSASGCSAGLPALRARVLCHAADALSAPRPVAPLALAEVSLRELQIARRAGACRPGDQTDVWLSAIAADVDRGLIADGHPPLGFFWRISTGPFAGGGARAGVSQGARSATNSCGAARAGATALPCFPAILPLGLFRMRRCRRRPRPRPHRGRHTNARGRVRIHSISPASKSCPSFSATPAMRASNCVACGGESRHAATAKGPRKAKPGSESNRWDVTDVVRPRNLPEEEALAASVQRGSSDRP
jgi:hypothetical protein